MSDMCPNEQQGGEFTDRLSSKLNEPSSECIFDWECMLLGIEHYLIMPCQSRINGIP
jgi:hypothetical protein